jgi:hypothetical protein
MIVRGGGNRYTLRGNPVRRRTLVVMGGIGVSIHLEIGVRKAIEWISHKRQEDPKLSLSLLVEEACRKFNLSPLQADFLYRHFIQTQ